MHGYYVNNKKNGKFTWWNTNNEKVYEREYKNNKLNGIVKSWSNGKIVYSLSYVDGVKNGLLTEWHSNGQKKSEGMYNYGVEVVDTWNFWLKNGEEDFTPKNIPYYQQSAKRVKRRKISN